MNDKTIQRRNLGLAKIDLAKARQQLSYDPDTGLFTWLVRSPGRTEIGQIAGSPDKDGYVRIGLQGQIVLAQVLAWMFMKGSIPEDIVDHADGDPSNNRWLNLRAATRAQNNRNSRVRKHSKTGIKGVQKHRTGKFAAKIQFGGKQHYLGLFDTAEEAGKAYADAAERLYGEFARTT